MSFGGHLQIPGPYAYGVLNVTANGNTIIVPGVAGKKIYVFFIVAGWATGPTNVSLSGGAITTGPLPTGTAGGTLVLDPSNMPWYETLPGNDLVMNQSGTSTIGGWFGYVQS